MTVRFLLDTNVLSEPMKPRPDPGIVRRMAEHAAEMAVPAPAYHELVFGIERLPRSRRRETLERYLEEAVHAALSILPYDAKAARWHASERARLTAIGRTPPFVDGQIAAVARVNGLVLVTANLSDYQDFADVETADWRRET